MSSNVERTVSFDIEKNQPSTPPPGPSKPSLAKDQIATIKRKRFRRIKSAPTADSSSSSLNSKPAATLPRPQSVFDYLHPSYRKVAILLIIYLGAGTLCFYFLRHQINGKKTNSVLDSVYFTVVTMTSVGYGDLFPGSDATILLACLFVFLGMLLIGLVLSKAADLLVEKQETLLAKALHTHQTVGTAATIKQMESHRERNKCIILLVLLVVLMGAGTTVLVAVEDLDFVHAFYCVVGTITSLGYIDKCFSTEGGRVFALFWILSGTVYLGQLLFSFAVLHTQSRQRKLVKWALKRKTTPADLEAADLDDDGVVVAAEFILYKLKEMGKISQEDMAPIMEEFERLDFDKTGTLTASDVLLSQSSWYAADILLTQTSV
ncbi:two pore domain potassium channel, EF-hand domain pair [Artemisia annua]|uniref:Two pore domain potassium channel, EF-hand domain pair n=1 Tax=Artemisia annua TaxID=35608 RepID=A0A2U1QHB4_ARTAN|nr:two pore domain potassium channel, EF-hand domain pair [Artemisia annua]